MNAEGAPPAEWKVFEQKNALRAAMRQQLAGMDAADLRERSRLIVARLTALPRLENGAAGVAVRAVAGRAGP